MLFIECGGAIASLNVQEESNDVDGYKGPTREISARLTNIGEAQIVPAFSSNGHSINDMKFFA